MLTLISKIKILEIRSINVETFTNYLPSLCIHYDRIINDSIYSHVLKIQFCIGCSLDVTLCIYTMEFSGDKILYLFERD